MVETVVVVGAGAGRSYNFPTGAGLSEDLAKRLPFEFAEDDRGELKFVRGDAALYQNLYRSHGRRDTENFARAGRAIADGISFFHSIDEFLHSRRDDPMLVLAGKIGIVDAISMYERKSTALMALNSNEYDQRSKGMAALSAKWMAKIFPHLSRRYSRADLPNGLFENIAFVNFNYDRCIEQYFYHAVQFAYSISPELAAETVSKLTVIHPYGRIGRLPWEQGSDVVSDFGHRHSDITSIAKLISTYTEQASDRREAGRITELIANASRVLFVGFGFHPQNMDILSDHGSNKYKSAFATAFLTSEAEADIFSQRIRKSFKVSASGPVIRRDLDCEGLISDFGSTVWG